MENKTLFLIPVPLDSSALGSIAPDSIHILKTASFFLVENERTARRFISKLGISVHQKNFVSFQSITQPKEVIDLMTDNQIDSAVVMSEVGCPCVADPGNIAVQFAHLHGWIVKPLPGPSSILMTLMASGFNGQNFAFNGYLPIQKDKAIATLSKLEKRMISENQTQIFIETPYRNQQIFELMLTTLHATTMLCLAVGLSTSSQTILVKSIDQWRKTNMVIHKTPCTFAIGTY